MEAILLDPVPAGIANPALPAGMASKNTPGNSPFANMLAAANGERGDGAQASDGDGRAANDATAAAALLALLLPQPQQMPVATAEGEPDLAIDAASLEHGNADPRGLALGLNGLAPGHNDLETVPGKALGLGEGDETIPDLKQGRNDAPQAVDGLAKTVSLAAAQSQPATSTPLPAELVEDQAGDADALKLPVNKASEVTPPSKSATDPLGEDTRTDAAKSAAQPEVPPLPAKPELVQKPVDRGNQDRRDQDLDPTSSVTTGYADRPHGLGTTNAAHPIVEKLSVLIDRPDLLAAHIQRAVANGRDRISVALVPADLGRIDISLDFDRGGKLSAAFAVDRPQTLEILRRDQHGLERALQDAGFRTDGGSLSFNLRGDQRQQQNPATAWMPAREPADPWQSSNRPMPHPAATQRVVADGRLDIEV